MNYKMNENEKGENKNLNSIIMVSTFVRKSLRQHFTLTNEEIVLYAQEADMTVDEYYLYLKQQRQDERERQQRAENARRNREYRARERVKVYKNDIIEKLEDLVSKDLDEVKISLKKLNNDLSGILEILSTSTSLIITGGSSSWTLNARNRGVIKQLIEGAIFTEIVESSVSDEELVGVIKNFDFITVKRVKPITKINKKKNTQPSGKWFRYYHRIMNNSYPISFMVWQY